MQRGHRLTANLILSCKELDSRNSRNLIFEIKGYEFPDEVVLVGGHTDSWDCQNDGCQGGILQF